MLRATRTHLYPVVVLLAVALLSGCMAKRQIVHHTLEENPASSPRKIVLLPVDVDVYERSAGGVEEEVPSWSEAAKKHIEKSLLDQLAAFDAIEVVTLPKLSAAEQKAVQEHLALYDVVAGTASSITRSPLPAWRHKREHFDYTLGKGLAFLKKRSGADAALIVVGQDVVSSSGRKAALVVAAIIGANLRSGHSYLSSGLVDLNSGNLLWFDHSFSDGKRDLREAEDSKAMVTELLDEMPRASGQVVAQNAR